MLSHEVVPNGRFHSKRPKKYKTYMSKWSTASKPIPQSHRYYQFYRSSLIKAIIKSMLGQLQFIGKNESLNYI